jgi:hypothetical protein
VEKISTVTSADYRYSMRGPLFCVASTNSWFVTRDNQKLKSMKFVIRGFIWITKL